MNREAAILMQNAARKFLELEELISRGQDAIDNRGTYAWASFGDHSQVRHGGTGWHIRFTGERARKILELAKEEIDELRRVANNG